MRQIEATLQPPACPHCKRPTLERAEKDEQPGDPVFWTRKKFWFDCASCAKTWECCRICHRGLLVEGTVWGQPHVQRVECKGGCGWGVAWKDPVRQA